MTFTVTSNLTFVAEFDTLREALAEALSESYRYDDIVMIEQGGIPTHFLKCGALYRAALEPAPETD